MKRLLEQMIRKQRGGDHYWKTLAPVVEAMTEQQAEAMFRIMQALESDSVQAGKGQAARKLGLPRGMV